MTEDHITPNDPLSTEKEWARSGNKFISRSRADMAEKLPSGVYRFVQTVVGWHLERTAAQFEFPFKVYSASDSAINRIATYWQVNGGNLGVLMNGLKGAGKTMTAQLLAKKLIEESNIPVLVVRDPIGLQLVFDATQQDMMIIFDEFEKTHNEDENPGCQQALLSTIDGMNRSSHNRLIIFTTNSPNINKNFQDRPSRIHYHFEFRRVADEIIEGLIDDGLPEDLKHFKGEIIDFLQSRKICTIDIVKAVINEVKTFREPPADFEDILNITKGDPPAYTVQILNPNTNVLITVVADNFKGEHDEHSNSLLAGNRARIETFKSPVDIYSNSWGGSVTLTLLEKCEEAGCWLAQIAVPLNKTPFKGFGLYEDDRLYLDNKPGDWHLPCTPESAKKDEDKMEKVQDLYDKSSRSNTVYGTGERAVFKIKVEPNQEAVTVTRWTPTENVMDFG